VETLEPIDKRMRSADASNRTLAAFARPGELVVDDELEDFEGPDAAAFGPLPLGVPCCGGSSSGCPA
jgi:hypothetical protein